MSRRRPPHRIYEGMFLVDPQAGSTQFPKVQEEITGLLTRHGAKLRHMRKWDERRLAYDIKGRSRGTYVLTYFEGPGSVVDGLRKDAKLSETILRALVLVHDERVPKDLRRAEQAPAEKPQSPAEAPAKT